MGRMFAEGLAETQLSLKAQIEIHLTNNHYPPLPAFMADVCLEAIEAGNEEEWDREIAMPEGVTYKGQTTAPAWAIIEQHHLDNWIDSEDY
jgi:hypothetical protein